MKLFLGILLAAGAAIGFVQQRRIAEVRTALAEKRETTVEVDRLRKENSEATKAALTAEQIAKMRAEKTELIRLRAGMADLRIAAQSPEKIQEEIGRLNNEAAQAEKSAQLEKASIEAKYFTKALQGTLQVLGSVVRVSAQLTGGTPARNFDELKEAMRVSGRFPNFDQTWEMLSTGFPPFNVTKDHFEFVPAAASSDGILLMRERQPRQFPDGTWTRLYLTTDYQIKEASLKEPDFTTWERENP